MAEPYLSELRALVEQWLVADPDLGEIECRHFFSGAAAYRDGAIVASLTPVGLAFKVPTAVRDDLLDHGLAVPLRYFPDAPVKRDYVLFEAGADAVDPVTLLRSAIPDAGTQEGAEQSSRGAPRAGETQSPEQSR